MRNGNHSPILLLILWILIFLATGPCCLPGQGTQIPKTIVLPDTEVGKKLAGYLAAINTGKREVIRAFVEANMGLPPNSSGKVDDMTNQEMGNFRQAGGYTVRKVRESSPVMIKVLVQANLTGAWMELTLFITAQPPDYVKAAAPYRIVGIGVGSIDTPNEFLSREKLKDTEIKAKTDALMSALAAQDAFSGSIIVAKEGKPLYAKAFGYASKAWHAKNRTDTRFNLASITKMFTAVAVAQLVEQGKLAYSDTVEKVLPDYPNKEVTRKVTLHHLLSHTSGMIGARALAEKAPLSPTARTIAEMVKPFAQEALSFPPGQQFDYSNAGFILLGAIIEKASGQSYYDYVRDHVFKPAGMTNTDFYELDTEPKNVATGYKDAPGGTRLSNIFDLGIKGSPAGMAYSTGEDMVKFHQALMQHKLLRQSSLEKLWTGVTEEPDQNTEYGYGAQIRHYNETRTVGHGGGWQGITNHFEMYPERGYTVVILSNYDCDPAAIASRLREWLTQGRSTQTVTPSAPPSLSLTASVSSTSVNVGMPVTITVTVRNTGGTAHASVIDMEVKDAKGAKANQQYTLGQKIEGGQTRTYTYEWTPMTAGTYTVDVGSFGPGWRPKHLFNSGVATITVH